MDAQNLRLRAIRECVEREPQVTIRGLAIRFTVSTMTIRRDLEKLEARGVLVRTFGGAMAFPREAAAPAPFSSSPVSPTKQTIGRLAASLVEPGQTVLVDAGTTTLEVVRHLPREQQITLITNSLIAAQEMAGAGLRLLLLGGYLSDDRVRLYGPLTEASLAGLHADVLFVGCVGASGTHGFYMSDLYLTSNVQAMVRAASRVVVVAESSKFHQRSLSCYATPDDIDIVVTDAHLPRETAAELEEHGVQVLLAE